MSFVYTVDVEDWYQVENLRPVLPRNIWLDCESRVEDAIKRLLVLCDEKGVKGTFFILAWIAKRHPRLVNDIAAAGHEIACHGFNHDMLTLMKDDEVRRDIADAKALLEDSSSASVKGYRAPNFSITEGALDILADLGFVYDSSLFPFTRHARYGRIGKAPFDEIAPSIYQHRCNGLLEFQLPMRNVWRITLPWAGGGYFRLLPGRLYCKGVRTILDEGKTFVFYMHTWEIDPGQPYVKGIRVVDRFRHYVGIGGAYRKLEQLLEQFGGTARLSDVAESVRGRRFKRSLKT